MKHTRLDTYAMSIYADAKAVSPSLTKEEIEARVAAISVQMRGPLSDLERAMLYNDRRDLRARLAEMP